MNKGRKFVFVALMDWNIGLATEAKLNEPRRIRTYN